MLMGCITMCAYAQPHTSRVGNFEVDFIRGCADLTINVTILVPGQCQAGFPCAITFGDGSPGGGINVLSHTYTTPGTYKLEVLFQGGGGTDDITITVFPNTPPTFELYACSGNEVTLNVTDRNYSEYVMEYSDGATATVDAGDNYRNRHVFATPGLKTATVRGRNLNAADNCAFATQDITVVPSITAPTVTQLQVVDNASIQLDYTAQPNILYRIEIATNNNTTFQLYSTTYNVTSAVVPNLRPDDNYYCFRVVAFDPCTNGLHPSNVICSSNVDLNVQNNSNNVNWITSATGVTSYTINKSYLIPNTTSTATTQLSPVSSPYSDNDIVCGTEYCYQVITNYPNGSKSVSLQKCGVAISTDPPSTLENISSVVENPGVTLNWKIPLDQTPQDFSVYKVFNGVSTLLGETTDLEISDPTYLTESGTCYKIHYDDVCGNRSAPSTEVCPIQLTGGVNRDNSISLSWTAYNGWVNGVQEYVLEKYSIDGQLLQTMVMGNSLAFADEPEDPTHQLFRYIIKANAVEAGLPQSISNVLTIIKGSNIYYPTAFTPNGDGLNDFFNVFGKYIIGFEMNIFNRWGELLYTSTTLDQGWDGTFNGKDMPEGTYTFVAEITDQAGRTFKKSGSVLLLEKK